MLNSYLWMTKIIAGITKISFKLHKRWVDFFSTWKKIHSNCTVENVIIVLLEDWSVMFWIYYLWMYKSKSSELQCK